MGHADHVEQDTPGKHDQQDHVEQDETPGKHDETPGKPDETPGKPDETAGKHDEEKTEDKAPWDDGRNLKLFRKDAPLGGYKDVRYQKPEKGEDQQQKVGWKEHDSTGGWQEQEQWGW